MPRLLLLDDDPDLRDTVSEYLRSRGHDVYTSGKPEDILAQIPNGEFSIAVIDLFLPDSDGLEVIEKAKNLRPGLKVIAISGGSKIETETCLQCARDLGADASIVKPFSLAELEKMIARLEAVNPGRGRSAI